MCERCEDLEFEVRRLQSLVGANATTNQIDTIRREFGVHPGQARLILALYRSKGVSHRDALYSILYGHDIDGGPISNIINAQVRLIRNNCGRDAVKTVKGIGYELGKSIRKRLDAIARENVLALI